MLNQADNPLERQDYLENIRTGMRRRNREFARMLQQTAVFWLLLNLLLPSESQAVERKAIVKSLPATTYYQNPDKFVRGLDVPVSDQMVPILMPTEMFDARLKSVGKTSPKYTYVEPITLFVPKDQDKRFHFLTQIANHGSAAELFMEVMQHAKESKESEDQKTLIYTFTPESVHLLDVSKYMEMNKKNHHQLSLDARKFPVAAMQELVAQVRPFLSRNRLNKLKTSVAAGDRISVDTLLLPDFASKVIRQHTAYRGPNCFHAALAFQDSSFVKSPLVNVKEEPGYHPSMINFDELWRVLKVSFYEINPERSPLKYGDMIVFFDVPEKNEYQSVNFHTIRHASTYLFDGYVFSKGSKSANTPYVIRTVAEEWGTWKAFAKNLGVKVYRRNTAKLRDKSVQDLSEWND